MTTIVEPTTGTLTYNLDPAHSSARFSVRHMMISNVRGDFSGLSGTLHLNRATPAESRVDVSIDVTSISTGQPDRDNHLKSGDFLDVAQFPTITFVSTGVAFTGDDEGKITGDLTIHGVTKSVVLDAEGSIQEINDLWGSLRVGFTGHTKIKRSEFGLVYNGVMEAGGVLIGDDVTVTVDAQFVRSAS